MKSKLLLVGEPMELFAARDEGPLETVKNYATAVTGAEFNVAVGLTRLGHTVGYMTKLGNDPFGRNVFNAIKKNKIDTSLITCDDNHFTGFMLRSKATSGNSEPFYYCKNSAASTITTDDLGSINLNEYQYLHITGILPALSQSTLDAAKYLMRKAKECGLTIFFDPDLRPQLWNDKTMMAYHINEMAFLSDYFLPGAEEGRILTGGLTTPESIASYYQVRGIPNVVVKVGPKGAYLATKKDHEYLPAYEIGKVADTSGAGDGFAAGVISGVMEGLPLREAVDRGNAIGSIQVMSAGDNEGLPDREQLTAFMKEHNRITNRKNK